MRLCYILLERLVGKELGTRIEGIREILFRLRILSDQILVLGEKMLNILKMSLKTIIVRIQPRQLLCLIWRPSKQMHHVFI